MTLEEYMDPKRFPLTTQGNLSPHDQMFIDAFNHGQMREYLDEGGTPEALTEG